MKTNVRSCQAKNPATCRFHGSPENLIKECAAKGDIKALQKLRLEIYRNYLIEHVDATQKLEQTEKLGLVEKWEITQNHTYPINEPALVNPDSQWPALQGDRYETHKTFTPVELAKLIRYDIKEAILNEYLPSELNYTVSTRGGGISVIINNTLPELSERQNNLEGRLRNILNNYTYKSLAPNTAYLGSHFDTNVRVAEPEEQTPFHSAT
jgi:hypothetical protein